MTAADLAITGGLVYDGIGAEGERVDVTVSEGRIAAVGPGLATSGAATEILILADTEVLCPGFIDTHSHSDFSILSAPECPSAVRQGITTQVVGQCGFSAAPLPPHDSGGQEEDPISGFPDVARDWRSFAGYREALETAAPAINVVPFVGHNTLRREAQRATGLGEAPSPRLQAELERLLEESVLEGARGFSTGLSYAPGRFSDDAEVAALVRLANRLGVPYHTHMRYETERVSECLRSALAITAQADADFFTISHLYPRYWSPESEVHRLMAQIDAARESADATFDIPPFVTGFTPWTHGLPEWAHRGGSRAIEARLRSVDDREAIIAFLEGPDAPPWAVRWEQLTIAKVNRPEHRPWLGQTIASIATERGTPPAATALDLVVADGHFWVSPVNKRQEDLDALVAHEACIPESDSMTVDPARHAALGITPRSVDTFPHFLAEYVYRRRVLDPGRAIAKPTSEAARRLRLDDRGAIRPGAAADLVVFDPAGIRAGPPDAVSPSPGIRHVMVNGAWVVTAGEATGSRSGVVLLE